MNAPIHLRESHERAPVPVHRPRRNPLRRHWLTGALLCGVLVIIGRTGTQLVRTEARLQGVQEQHSQLTAQIDEARRANAELQAELNRVSSDSYREVMAKQLGFIHPNETVYQKGK